MKVVYVHVVFGQERDDSPDAFQRLKVEILLPVARGEEEMSIAKWLVPLSCTSRGEVANARPRRTKGPTPDVWTPVGGPWQDWARSLVPPPGGSSDPAPDPILTSK